MRWRLWPPPLFLILAKQFNGALNPPFGREATQVTEKFFSIFADTRCHPLGAQKAGDLWPEFEFRGEPLMAPRFPNQKKKKSE